MVVVVVNLGGHLERIDHVPVFRTVYHIPRKQLKKDKKKRLSSHQPVSLLSTRSRVYSLI